MKPEWISLILSIGAVVLSYVHYRHQVKPSVKIISVINNSDSDVIVIELERLKHGYHFHKLETICMGKCTIVDYGQGSYTPTIPTILQPKRVESLHYWINPKSASKESSCLFWFSVSKNEHDRWLRLKFKNISFPYKSSCVIPIISNDISII